MDLFAISPNQAASGQIALAAILAIVGFMLLLPRPRRRFIAGGVAALTAALVIFAAWLFLTFGKPSANIVETALFILFSLGALFFGSVLVVQRNPARGAIAFAFVIVSTCGLFLILAAPFLMAATIIIYAGAIIVTFLFVLMLSQVQGASNENDRSREPILSGLAGFSFVGLVLFSIYVTDLGRRNETDGATETRSTRKQSLPLEVLTSEERAKLADVAARLDGAEAQLSGDLKPGGNGARIEYFSAIKTELLPVVGVSSLEPAATVYDGSIRLRLEREPGRPGHGAVLYREDQQAQAVLTRTGEVRDLNYVASKQVEDLLLENRGDRAAVLNTLNKLRSEVLLLSGSAELPARNVENLGYELYARHLLAVEMAGTLLLVSAIGAVAIANRKGFAA
jgi:NADH:ubiquinone oxidoreductase subunit 6 (subunit J)